MKSITQDYQNDKKVSSSIKGFFKKYQVSTALRAANAYKSKGIHVAVIFQYLFSLIFTNRSMYMNMLMGTHQAGFGKDTVYRFTNSIHINWIKFTTWLSAQIIKESITELTDEKRVNVLIVDDTLFERSSSKKVELLSKVYDHAKKAYKFGFRLLTLGWSDGNSFIPVNGCLLSTENRKNRINEAVSLDKRSAGYTRRNLAQTKATVVVLELIKTAKKALIPASHVLFDTWFCSPSSLNAIKEMGYDVIAMAKKTPKMHYLYNGKMQPLTEIYKQNKKRRGKSRYLLSVEVALNKDEKLIPARIVYVRNKNKRKDYLALITTDMNISEDEIIRIYGKRWDIEVFFKVCKSYLKLSKECNSLSYDGWSDGYRDFEENETATLTGEESAMKAVNETIRSQLKHRTIREFKDEKVPQEIFELLMEVARRTATSTGSQASSIVRVTDQKIKAEIAKVCNQEYVARAPELLVFIVDQYRNNRIAAEQNCALETAGDMDRFFAAFTDACIMAQNVVTAAESMGLGAVYLGSILNNPERICELLKLPELTFPVIGLGFGYPNQNPQLKPRMEMRLRVFENAYTPFESYLDEIKEYDEEMRTYYDLRDPGRPVDSFSKQVVSRLKQQNIKRQEILNVVRKQGFDLMVK